MMVDERRVAWEWIDNISFVDADEAYITAQRKVSRSEWYFAHHFECHPVVPGVFIIEMMSHAAALLQILRVWGASAEWAHYILAGTDQTRFYHRIEPDAEVELAASIRQGDDEQVLLRARASVGGQRVARTDVILQRVRADWLTRTQDVVIERELRRVLSDDLKHRYNLR